MVDLSSYIHTRGPEVNTRTVVSQKVRLFSFLPDGSGGGASPDQPINQIGTLSSFSASDSRGSETVRGIGFGDRVAEIVPGVTDTTISASRAALWLQNIFQSFGYNSGVDGIIRSLRHHKWPFDIRQEMIFSEIIKSPSVNPPVTQGVTSQDSQPNMAGVNAATAGTFALLTFYEGCWMTSFDISFSSDSAVVTENCSISVSDVTAGPVDSSPQLYFDEDSLGNKAFRVNPA